MKDSLSCTEEGLSHSEELWGGRSVDFSGRFVSEILCARRRSP